MIEYKISNITSEEIYQAVRIQIRELPQGFLSSLGEKPLFVIFSHITLSKFGIIVIAKEIEHNNVIGYVLGTTNIGKLYKDFLLKKTFQAILYFFPKLISWRRIKKIFETVLYPIRKGTREENRCDAELLDLAVMRKYHGTGVAINLFENFVNQCRARDIKCFDIPTSEGLDRAHHFYEKVGAKRIESMEVHEGQKTLIYRYIIL